MPLLHPVHADEEVGHLHVSHGLEQLNALPDGGAGGDHVLHDGDDVAILGLVAHHAAAFAVVLGLLCG